jgi:hypothetical protein
MDRSYRRVVPYRISYGLLSSLFFDKTRCSRLVYGILNKVTHFGCLLLMSDFLVPFSKDWPQSRGIQSSNTGFGRLAKNFSVDTQ